MVKSDTSLSAYYEYLVETGQRIVDLDDLIRQELFENFSGVYIHNKLISNQECILKIISLLREDGKYIVLQTEHIDIKILKGGINKFIIFIVDGVLKVCARCIDHYEYHADIRDFVVLQKFSNIDMRGGGYVKGDIRSLYFYGRSEGFGNFSEKMLFDIFGEAAVSFEIIQKQEKINFLFDGSGCDEEDIDMSGYYEYLEQEGSRLIEEEDLDKIFKSSQPKEKWLSLFDVPESPQKRKKMRRGSKGRKHKMRGYKYIRDLLESISKDAVLRCLEQYGICFSSKSSRKIHGQETYYTFCPFHQENTPSFVYTPNNGHFHCFGCQWEGNLYDVLSLINGKKDGYKVLMSLKKSKN